MKNLLSPVLLIFTAFLLTQCYSGYNDREAVMALSSSSILSQIQPIR